MSYPEAGGRPPNESYVYLPWVDTLALTRKRASSTAKLAEKSHKIGNSAPTIYSQSLESRPLACGVPKPFLLYKMISGKLIDRLEDSGAGPTYSQSFTKGKYC